MMCQPPTITAAIITKDEADNLRELLPKLDWADQIVVVDSGSSDDTIKIAAGHGCDTAVHPFDTFAKQRNRALDLSRGTWVLSIDADERPTPRLLSEMLRAIRSDRFAAYRVPIRSEILGRPVRRGGTQDDRPVRFFRRDSACWKGDVHEVLEVNGRVGELAGWLEHRTLPTYAAFLEKIDRYTALEAAARVRQGRSPTIGDALVAPTREVLRRLVYKLGLLDGPAGWQFALLSGYSEWVLARRHRQLWAARNIPSPRAARDWVGAEAEPSLGTDP
jgi:glycosyltransferase involved in cell wall biosynthesis